MLGDRDKRDLALVEEFQKLREVKERARQPVDLVNNNAVDITGLDLLQKVLESGTVGVGAGEARIIVALWQRNPAFLFLAGDVALGGLALDVERGEVLLKIIGCRDTRIDRAADSFRFFCGFGNIVHTLKKV